MAARTRSRSVLYVILLGSLTLLASRPMTNLVRGRVQDQLAGLDAAGSKAARPANRAISKAISFDKLKKENERLRTELEAAKAASLRYDDALRERKELLALNGFTSADDYPSVSARIVGASLNNFDTETVRIDRGSDDGIVVDLPVVSGAGLVGRISAVSPKHASVQLISDPQMSVGVRFARSGEVALARGQRSGRPLRLDLVALDAAIAAGDVVVTSGLQNSRFPPEIPVGRVRNVRPGSILKEVLMTPAADIERISFVKVLLTRPSGVTPPVVTAPPTSTSVVPLIATGQVGG